jgi:hypothetical protein
MASRTLTSEIVADNPAGYDIGVDSETSFYGVIGGPALRHYDVDGSYTVVTTDFDTPVIGGVQYVAGRVIVLPGSDADLTFNFFNGSSVANVSVGFNATGFFEGSDGDAWLVGPVRSGGDVGLDRGDRLRPRRQPVYAHIIYDGALTEHRLGHGHGLTDILIDVDSFEDAGVVLYNEPLGLSMIWTRQSSIQDFIQEVLDHIQAALFVDPQTGLLTLKLIRGDYDVGTLPTIDPSNATLTNFGRKLWGEIVNEISVTWTNPDNEQDETVTVHDLASITTQGGIISDSRNYYGVRYAPSRSASPRAT